MNALRPLVPAVDRPVSGDSGRLTALPAAVAEAVRDSTAENTRRAYTGALRRFGSWLADRGVHDFDALRPDQQDAAIAEWLTDRDADGIAPATLALDYAAVGRAARDAGRDDPRGPVARRTLAGLRRRAAAEAAAGNPRGRGQAVALRWSRADAAAAVAEAEGTAAGFRDAAIVRLASDCLLRVSEVAAVRVADLQDAGDGSGRLTVRRSKSDQGGEGATLFVGPAAWRAVRAWLTGARIVEGPVFRRVWGRCWTIGAEALSPFSVRRIIGRRAEAVGVRGASGHSLRVGSAQSLVSRGGSTAELQQAGRWKDARTATRYAANELASRGAVARLRYGAEGAS